MQVEIEFTERLRQTAGGVLPGSIGAPFPYEVIAVSNGHAIALKEPSTITLNDRIITMTWRRPAYTIGVSVHVSRVSGLKLKFP